MSGEQFSLVWNSFPTNLSSGLYNLLNDEQLVDVTLAVEGKILRAHKLILSVCSTYFEELFKINSCKHPIVILKDVNYHDLSAILHFMYQGKVNVKREDLSSFLKVAETLQIKGLTRDKIEKDDRSIIEETNLEIEENQQENETVCQSSMESEAHLELDTKLESSAVIEDEGSAPVEEKSSPIPENNERLDFSCVSLPLRTSEPEPESLNYRESVDDEENAPTASNSNTQEILSSRLEDYREQMLNTVNEPLDYTSDIARLPKTENEPPDYSSDIEFDVECNKPTQENLIDIKDRDLQMDNNSTRQRRIKGGASWGCSPGPRRSQGPLTLEKKSIFISFH